MASRSPSARWRFTLIALIFAAVVAFAQWKGWMPPEYRLPDLPHGKEKPTRSPIPPQDRGASGKSRSWEEWSGCTLVEHRDNDGDSFLVRYAGGEVTLRLYFVDCPEKYRHQYNGDRIAEQGRYFGGLTGAETIGIGETARDFTLQRLRSAPFAVLTRGEPVYDSGRQYAFVTLKQGDLAELLVQAGLARIYTKGTNRPGGRSSHEEKERLQKKERQAKASGMGAWGLR